MNDRLLRLGARYNADTSVEMHPLLRGRARERADRASSRSRPNGCCTRWPASTKRTSSANARSSRTSSISATRWAFTGGWSSWMQTALFPAGTSLRPANRGQPGQSPAADAGRRAQLRADALPTVQRRVAGDRGASGDGGDGTRGVPPARVGHRARRRRVAAANQEPAGAAATVDTGRAAPPAGRLQARPDVLKAAVALPEILIAYDLGGGGYDTAIAKILTAHAAETALRERLMPDPDVLRSASSRSGGARADLARVRDRAGGRSAARRDRATRRRTLIWRSVVGRGPPGLTAWEGWQQSTVLDLRQAALADAIFDAEPFLGRALDRASAFHATGAVEAYDRVLATIGAVQHRANSRVTPSRCWRANAPTRCFSNRCPKPSARRPGGSAWASSDNLPMATTRLRARRARRAAQRDAARRPP